MDVYHKILQQYWGYTSFRDIQEDIIHSVGEKRDTLGLMPTGGGKSLTFQVPAMSFDGLCIVVSPLIALMKDQVENLKKRGIKAMAVYSGMSRQELVTAFENVIYGDYKFLYISPERLATKLFLAKLQYMNVSLLVVDEAHCISQWGYDFRPSYQKIAAIREKLPQVPVLALTATATEEVVDDIQKQLGFKEKNIFRKSFERKNLAYIVRSSEDKNADILKILSRIEGSALVYVRSQKKTKEIADYLTQNGFQSDYFHAGLPRAEKDDKQRRWTQGTIRVMVCTNAFGMGIDKADVRLVVHVDLPNSIEEYFQEAGRAGRDGEKAYAVILHNRNDLMQLKKRVADEFPDREFIKKVYLSICYFFQVAENSGAGSTFGFSIFEFCKTYKLQPTAVHSALKLLDLGGYIEYTDEINNSSRLMFTIYRDDLYHYNLDAQNERLVNTLLRQYTGLFADYVTIDEDLLAAKTDKKRTEVYEMLCRLDKYHLLSYIPHKRLPLITFVQPRLDDRYLVISKTIYEERRTRLEKHINAMVGYVTEKDRCRSRVLLSYFDEDETSDCCQCDICLARTKSGLTNYKYNQIASALLALLESEAKPLEQIVEQLSASFSQKEILDVLAFMVDNNQLVQELNKISLKNLSQ